MRTGTRNASVTTEKKVTKDRTIFVWMSSSTKPMIDQAIIQMASAIDPRTPTRTRRCSGSEATPSYIGGVINGSRSESPVPAFANPECVEPLRVSLSIMSTRVEGDAKLVQGDGGWVFLAGE